MWSALYSIRLPTSDLVITPFFTSSDIKSAMMSVCAVAASEISDRRASSSSSVMVRFPVLP